MLVGHLGNLGHLRVGIGCNELFDHHVATSYSDDQLTVQDLGKDFLGSEQIETVSKFPDGHRAVGLVQVVAEHLVQHVTFRSRVDRPLALLLLDLFIHDLDNLVLVGQESLQLVDEVNLCSNSGTEIVESLDEQLFVLLETSDVVLVSVDVSLQVGDLTGLQLNLLVQVDLLLTDDV